MADQHNASGGKLIGNLSRALDNTIVSVVTTDKWPEKQKTKRPRVEQSSSLME